MEIKINAEELILKMKKLKGMKHRENKTQQRTISKVLGGCNSRINSYSEREKS